MTTRFRKLVHRLAHLRNQPAQAKHTIKLLTLLPAYEQRSPESPATRGMVTSDRRYENTTGAADLTAISDLDIFARVARTGNMSAAGREMGMSPAVVSKRISMLEERLGVRLFQRTTRHLTLTETGEGYFKRVTDILSLVEEAEDFVSRRNAKPRGQLKLSVPTAFSEFHVIPHLEGFMARYPEIDLDFYVSDHLVDIIRDGFDLAIRIGDLKDSSLVAKRLAADPRVLVAAPGYLARRGTPMVLEDLETHVCLPLGHDDHWRLADKAQTPIAFRLPGAIRSNSAAFTRSALLAGIGIGLRSLWEIGADLESGRLVRVLPQFSGTADDGIFAVYPSRDFVPAKVSVFIDYYAKIFSERGYWETSRMLDRRGAG